MTREEELEDMIRKLIGDDEDRDQYLRPAEFALVKEARLLLGESSENRSPDFGPDGILTVEGTVVDEADAAPVAPIAPSAPPAAPRAQPSVRPAVGAVAGAAGAAVGAAAGAPPSVDEPYEAPPPVAPARPLESILSYKFRFTAGMAGSQLLSDQVRNVCRVHRIRTSVSEEGLASFTDIRVGNTHALYDGKEFFRPDLADFRDGKPFGTEILQPFELFVKVEVTYSGKVPDGLRIGQEFEIDVMFEGRIRHARPAVRQVQQ